MKKDNLITGVIAVSAGLVFLLAAILTDSKLDSLLFGFASADIASGIVMICKYFYWSKPENTERYAEKLEAERIELHDELKVKLRDKSGRYAYVSGLITVSIAIVVYSVLGTLDIIAYSRTIILCLSGYLLFQYVTGIVIFRHLCKAYQ